MKENCDRIHVFTGKSYNNQSDVKSQITVYCRIYNCSVSVLFRCDNKKNILKAQIVITYNRVKKQQRTIKFIK